MSDRPSIRAKDWRELSTRVSPDIVAGFDVAGIAGLTKPQQQLMALPRNFRIHKMHDNYHLITTASALCLYGELDRAVTGLLPLQEVPVWEYNIPDYGSTLYAVRGTAFFARHAGREDLVERLAPLLQAPPFYDPKPITMTSRMLSQDLDLTEAELAGMRHITSAEWIERYVDACAAYGRAYSFGGSEEYPPERILHEISRFATKIFTTPGYEPYNDHHYPIG